MPRFQLDEPELTNASTSARGTQLGRVHVLVYPLLRNDGDKRRCQTERQAHEPERVDPKTCSGRVEGGIRARNVFGGAGSVFIDSALNTEKLVHYDIHELCWVDL